MFSRFPALMAFVASLAAQQPAPRDAEPPRENRSPGAAVRIPAYPNSTCPIMGKKVSMALSVDTELGRFWVCCKPCFKKVLADLPNAHKSAYPTVQPIANERCPVSGEELGEQRKEMVLQGSSFHVCCAGCIATARAEAQLVLAKLHEPKLRDVGNRTCPITGKPVTPNTFAVVGGDIVHLSAAALVTDVEKAPAEVLAKARAIAAEQPPPPKHEHTAAAAEPDPKEGEPKAKERKETEGGR